MTDLDKFITTTREVLNRITPETDIVWTRYKTVDDLKTSINQELNELEKGNWDYLDRIYVHFLATATFQEIQIDDQWEQEYLDIAERMDELYMRLKPFEKPETNLEKLKQWTKSLFKYK